VEVVDEAVKGQSLSYTHSQPVFLSMWRYLSHCCVWSWKSSQKITLQ